MQNKISIDLYPCLVAEGRNQASTSVKYQFISTKEVIEVLVAQGWELVKVKQGSRAGKVYGKHMVEFKHPMYAGLIDEPRIYLTNAHDGTGSFCLYLGIYRLVCSNGLVVGKSFIVPQRIRHVGYATSKVQAALSVVAAAADRLSELVRRLKTVQTTPEQRLQLAQRALELRYGDQIPPVQALKMLEARRAEDTADDLYTVLNRIQENIVRGGAQYLAMQSNGRLTNRTIRAVNSVDASIKLNQGLFDEALKLAA